MNKENTANDSGAPKKGAKQELSISNGDSLKGKYPPGLDWNISIPSTDLVSLVEETIKEYADKPCIDFLGTKYTYKEVGELIDKAAEGFKKMGIGKNKRVGLFMPNTPYHAIMFFGALKTGATIVNFDSQYDEKSLARQIKDSGTELMITVDNPQFYPKVKNLIDNGELKSTLVCPMHTVLKGKLSLGYDVINFGTVVKAKLASMFNKSVTHYKSFMKNKPSGEPSVKIDQDDLAVLQYTGGTTGVSKGAMLSHGNLVANATQIENYMSCEEADANKDKLFVKGEDKMMAALPYFHIFGMTVSMVGSMRMGAELLILPNPRDVKQVLQTIHDKKPDVFPVVPRLLRAMLDSPDLNKYDISSLKIVMSGGAALSPDLKKEFEDVTGIPVIQGYGLTETSPVACVHHPLAADNDANSVGYVVPKTEVMIADVNSKGQLNALPAGQTGEICIKGPQVMKGYWQKPEENKKVLSGAWFKTGDVGHIGENGQIYITDRIKDMGLINGKNVYAVPIEKEIQQHSDVLECNVVFVKDKSAGEAAMAFMRIKEGSKLSETELRSFFEDNGMSKYHKPKHLVFWSHDKELPKTNVGKPDKKELRIIAQNILNEKSKQSSPKPPTME